jgi:hypothetical protein
MKEGQNCPSDRAFLATSKRKEEMLFTRHINADINAHNKKKVMEQKVGLAQAVFFFRLFFFLFFFFC